MSVHHGGQPVGDDQRGLVLRHALQFGLDGPFVGGVQRAGGFVKNLRSHALPRIGGSDSGQLVPRAQRAGPRHERAQVRKRETTGPTVWW